MPSHLCADAAWPSYRTSQLVEWSGPMKMSPRNPRTSARELQLRSGHTSPRGTALSLRCAPPWMIEAAKLKLDRQPASPRSTTPLVLSARPAILSPSTDLPAEVTTRAQTAPIAERARLGRSRGCSTRASSPPDRRIFALRSDASPTAFKYAPRETGESWPPRELHHLFGHYDPRALRVTAPHAFPGAFSSVSPASPRAKRHRVPNSLPTKVEGAIAREEAKSGESTNLSGTTDAMGTTNPLSFKGDVHGRRKALERLQNPKISPYFFIKPLGQPPPAKVEKRMIQLNRAFIGLENWTSALSKDDPARRARESLRVVAD